MAETVGRLFIDILGRYTAGREFTKGKADIEAFTKTIESSGKRIEEITVGWIGSQVRWGTAVGESFQSLSKASRQAVVSTAQIKPRVKDASASLQTFSKSLQTTSNSLWLMTMGLQQFGRAMTASFTIPIMGAAALAVKTFMDFEKGTVSIQRAAGITREAADSITQDFKNISLQAPLTVEELQKAGYAAAQAGVTGEQGITNFAKAAVMLSKTGGDAFKDLPIEQLADNLAKLGIAFRETGDNWERANNIASMLVSVSSAIPGSLDEVVTALSKVSAAAKTYGVDMTSATAIMGTLVAATVPASRAGTEMTRVLTSMAIETDALAELLGYTREEMIKMKETDMAGVLVELTLRFKELNSTEEKTGLLMDLVGRVGLRAMMPLIENTDLLAQLMGTANQAMKDGTLITRMFEIEANSLSGTFQVFQNVIKIMAETLEPDLAPYVSLFLKTFTEGLRQIIGWWQQLSPQVKTAIVLFSGLLAIIGPLALLLNTLFLNPIAGMVTFLWNLGRMLVELGLTVVTTQAAAGGMSVFAATTTLANIAIKNLGRGLLTAVVIFAKFALIVGVVVGALYLLGRALGIKIKVPKLPEIKIPEIPRPPKPDVTPAGEELEMATKADKKAAQKRLKELRKESKAKRRARNKEIKIIEESIEQREKLRDAELKGFKDSVEEQQEILYQRREAWEDERLLKEEEIAAATEVLKIAKDELRSLKKAQKKESDVAKGRVAYAKMNLEAAQNNLKKLKILGKDEFDAEFRAAQEAVELWEARVQLAQEELIILEKQWDEEIDTQQDIVDQQNDFVDDLRKAMAERERLVRKEIDIIEDELKLRQNALSKLTKQENEKIALLREERDVIADRYDEELLIIQDRIDATQDAYDAISDMALPTLPDVPESIKNWLDAINAQTTEINAGLGELIGLEGFGVGVEGGLIDFFKGLPAYYKELWAEMKKEAERTGKSIPKVFLEATATGLNEFYGKLDKLWMDALWGKGAWDLINDEAERTGKTTVEVLHEAFWTAVREKFSGWWGVIKKNIFDPISDKIGEWWTIGGELITSLRKGMGSKMTWLWESTTAWMKGVADIVWGYAQRAWSWGTELIASLRGGMNSKITWLWESLKPWMQGVADIIWGYGSDAYSWGSHMIGQFREGVSSRMNWLWESLKPWFQGVADIIWGYGNSARSWGAHMINEFKEGIAGAWDGLKGRLDLILKWIKDHFKFSVPLAGPLRDADKWMPHFMELLARGVESKTSLMTDALGDVLAAAEPLSDMQFGTGGGLNIASPASAAAAQVGGVVAEAPVSGESVTIEKHYHIEPGMMIASQGEIRNFVRILREYQDTEEERTILPGR